ncbi:NTP transferase domain-containing protein [Chelatococcus sp. GCM10030263]|uniref:nucleotidyltransferase family protein n=1 Tax=Chelatococcus sp. GCM10030263 TaxID=3273387 RepID=UPI003614DB3B
MIAIAAIVLAAGRSTRMGGPNKLLLPLAGKPVVAHAVEAGLASKATPVIVVTGHQADAVTEVLAGYDVRAVDNPDYATGLASSLKAGIRAVSDDADGALVVLGDMPAVTPDLLDRLIETFEARPDATAAVPVRKGQRGNPVLLGRALFPAVLKLAADEGARRIIKGEGVVEIPVEDEAIAADVDTPEAFAEVAQRFKR